MKVSQLLEKHNKFKDRGLSFNLGDGFLVSNNRIYRNVREATSKYGFVFEADKNPAYETFPLLQLENILSSKRLPYSNNVIPLEVLSPQSREKLTWEDLDGNLKKNFLFHESCHGIARHFADKIMGQWPTPDSLPNQRMFAFRTLVEESCANACELFGALDAADQTHRIFFEMNSYICHFEIRSQLNKIANEIGGQETLKFIIICYLYSNFLYSHLDDRQMPQILKLVTEKTIANDQIKTLRSIGKVAFLLSERFRFQTTEFQLRLAGIETPIQDLFDFDLMKELKDFKSFSLFLNEISQCLTKEI